MNESENLPSGWATVKLSDSALSVKGKKPKQLESECLPGLLPYIDIAAFNKGVVRQYADVASSQPVTGEQVVVVWDGARSGLAGIGQEGALGSTLVALTALTCTPKYLYYFLQSQYDYINSNPRGTGIPHVDPEIFWNIEIPIPPLNEQRRIVEKLTGVLQRVESCRARLDGVPMILKRFRQSVLAAACSGRLTADWRAKHPDVEEWKTRRADDICESVQSGSTPKQGFRFDCGIPFLKVYNIVNQKINFEYRPQFVDEATHKGTLKRAAVKPGDVLMNIVGPPLGKVAIVPNDYEEWNINQAIVLFRPKPCLDNQFLYLLLCSGVPYAEILQETRGSAGQANISLSQCRAMEFLTPRLEEQREIVRRVNELFAWADSIEARYTKARAHFDKLTPAILAKAFCGELVPQDPNDEPATELLERIRAQRQQADSAPKPRGPRAPRAVSGRCRSTQMVFPDGSN